MSRARKAAQHQPVVTPVALDEPWSQRRNFAAHAACSCGWSAAQPSLKADVEKVAINTALVDHRQHVAEVVGPERRRRTTANPTDFNDAMSLLGGGLVAALFLTIVIGVIVAAVFWVGDFDFGGNDDDSPVYDDERCGALAESAGRDQPLAEKAETLDEYTANC